MQCNGVAFGCLLAALPGESINISLEIPQECLGVKHLVLKCHLLSAEEVDSVTLSTSLMQSCYENFTRMVLDHHLCKSAQV